MHMRFWGATLARNLPAALEIYADILRRPHLPDEELDAGQGAGAAGPAGPGGRAAAEGAGRAAQAALPAAAGPATAAAPREGIDGLTADVVREHYERHFRPHGTILSVAGNIEWEPLRDQVGRLFGDWQAARSRR